MASSMPSPTNHFDLIVIGGGSGGLAASKEASSLGARVALFDYVSASPQGSSWGLGGTCVNVGCIPKKLLHVAALVGENVRDASHFGWSSSSSNAKGGLALTHNWPSLIRSVQEKIKGSNWSYKVALREEGVSYINAQVCFVEPGKIAAKTKELSTIYTASNFIIAVGGRPHYPEDVEGAQEHGLTSDDLFSLREHPGKTLLIGGSYVALECAGFLAGLGIDTTVMVRSAVILRGFDAQMAHLVGSYLEEECGVKFQWERIPISVRKADAGAGAKAGAAKTFIVKSKAAAKLNGSTSVFVEEFNTVIFATGRRPATGALNLEAAGVAVDEEGYVLADEGDGTSSKGIYAIGDCVKGRPQLTPAAIQAGLLLARRLYGSSQLLTDYHNCPTTIFTPMEYGCVGASEEDAIRAYGMEDVEVYHAHFTPFESLLLPPPKDLNKGYLKVICRKSDKEKILGLHYLGRNAGEVIQGFAVALRLGARKEDLDGTIGIHPTAAENFSITLNITKASGKDPTKKVCCG